MREEDLEDILGDLELLKLQQDDRLLSSSDILSLFHTYLKRAPTPAQVKVSDLDIFHSLSPFEIQLLKRIYSSSMRQAAKDLAVSYQTVSRIVQGVKAKLL